MSASETEIPTEEEFTVGDEDIPYEESFIAKYPDFIAKDGKARLKTVTVDDVVGSIGVDPITGKIMQVVERNEGTKNNPRLKIELSYVSDCAVFIERDTTYDNKTEFTFIGIGAKDHQRVKFTLVAEDLQLAPFITALHNHFRSENIVGSLNYERVQLITKNQKHIRRIEVPQWIGNVPMVDGIGEDLAPNTEFKLACKTPARVYSEKSPEELLRVKGLLKLYLQTHPMACILLTTILGCPAVAKWQQDNRIGIAMWHTTGTQKTTAMQIFLSVFGTAYNIKAYLLKHGKDSGTTAVGASTAMAKSGILPQPYDNFKMVVPKDDIKQYVSLIQTVMEGADKTRGNVDGGLRESKIFFTAPIVTGEVQPEEASTDARILNLNWTAPDLKKLTELQENVELLPIIGYHWLRYLAQVAASGINPYAEFNRIRTQKESEFARSNPTNAGRLASIYAILDLNWKLLLTSPFGDIFAEFTDEFYKTLDVAIEEQKEMVTSHTEVSKFIEGLKELIASRPSLFQKSDSEYTDCEIKDEDSEEVKGYKKKIKELKNDISIDKPYRIIGKYFKNGLFLLPTEALREVSNLGVFSQQPTESSMTRALDSKGYLIRGKEKKDGKNVERRKYKGCKINGSYPWGWYLKEEVYKNVPDVPEGERDGI